MTANAGPPPPVESPVPPAALAEVETPCIVVDTGALERNLEVLSRVQREAGVTILLALKGFAMWSVFPQVRRHLAGVAASSLHEALLGREKFGGEVHVYAPAYDEPDLREMLAFADHLVFNSFPQWRRFRAMALEAARGRAGASGGAARPLTFGIRVNPEHSEVTTRIYDPCAPGSRLGVTAAEFRPEELEGIDGLHFHTLCELNADALERTLPVVEAKFGAALAGMTWVNMGGGHHISRPDYDVERLIRVLRAFRERHPHLRVYLEPGEAIALHTGVLVASVLDLIRNEVEIAILDTSATAHMPDVLEMPYRPVIVGAGQPGEHAHTYRLGGMTCLAGDVIGDYSFPEPLRIGRKLVFLDMAHYTMVKSTTFNGVRLPSIATHDPATGKVTVVRRFRYQDYRDRLS